MGKYIRPSVLKMHYDRKKQMLEYMKTEQASTDAAVELDIPQQSVWRYLREMQKSGHVVKIGDSFNAKYKATGKHLTLEERRTNKVNTGFIVCGVQF
jgi:predicted transcriptional regulator